MQLELLERQQVNIGRSLRRATLSVFAATSVVLLIAGCDYLKHDVQLASVWDGEAANALTSQEDVSHEICQVTSKCFQALRSDQAMVLKFGNDADAAAETQPGDSVISGIFVIHWTAEVSQEDKKYVEDVLEEAIRTQT